MGSFVVVEEDENARQDVLLLRAFASETIGQGQSLVLIGNSSKANQQFLHDLPFDVTLGGNADQKAAEEPEEVSFSLVLLSTL